MLGKTLIRAGRHYGVSLAFAALVLLVFLIPGASTLFQLDRETIHGIGIWTLLGSHFSHWNFDHLIWDLITFLALGMFCERRSRIRFLTTLGISATAVSLTFLLYETNLTHYRGLSGIDSALFGLALTEICTNAKRIALIAALGFLAKLTFELITGTPVFVPNPDATFTVLPSAHLAGFISGLGVGAFSFFARS